MPVRETTLDGIIQPHETYLTPPPVIRAQIATLGEFVPTFILDPCMGTGNYGVELRDKFPKSTIVGVDIQSREELLHLDSNFDNNCRNYNKVFLGTSIFDYVNVQDDKSVKYDLIITNPPFSLTQRLLEHLWPMLARDSFISFLNRIELLESKTRYDNLFRKYKLDGVTVSIRRIPFLNHPAGKKGKGDYKMYGFYNFTNNEATRMMEWSILNLTDWKDFE